MVQAQRDDAIVAQLPEPSLGVPGSTGLLHPVANGHLGKGDAHPEKLDGLESLLPLGIVAIAHADEAVTVLREELFRAVPARWKTWASEARPLSANRADDESASRNVLTPIRRAGRERIGL